MKLTAPRKLLVSAFDAHLGTLGKTPAIFSHVHVDAQEDSATLRSTDGIIGLTSTLDCKVDKAGCFCLPAKDTLERIKAMPDGPVQLEVSGDKLSLKAATGPRRFTIFVLPGVDFPPPPKPKSDSSLSFKAGDFADLIAATKFAVSPDETRAHVNSLCLEADGKVLRAVATDGHRLAKKEATLVGTGIETTLISLRALGVVSKLLGSVGLVDDVTLYRDAAHFGLRIGDIQFTGKVIDAAFPPWAQVIPKKHTTTAMVPRAALSSAVSAVGISASSQTNGVKLEFSGNRVVITAESADTGNASDEVPADITGPGGRIGFNGRYIVDAMGAFDSETVRIEFAGELDPLVVKPESGDGQLIVLMPMRI